MSILMGAGASGAPEGEEKWMGGTGLGSGLNGVIEDWGWVGAEEAWLRLER